MKYVIFEDATGARFPVLMGNHVVHSQVNVEGCRPIAAGEWKLAGGRVITYGSSTSLNLKPRLTDAKMIMLTLANADSLLIMENARFVETKRRKAHQAEVVRPVLDAAKVKQQAECRHKFVDSKHCLLCGWAAPAKQEQEQATAVLPE
jgi:hypothetical protein